MSFNKKTFEPEKINSNLNSQRIYILITLCLMITSPIVNLKKSIKN